MFKRVCIFGIIVISIACRTGQKLITKVNFQKRENIRVVFYNTENYFDYLDDSLTNDEQFTSNGDFHWTKNKFYNKRNNLVKTITAIGEWDFPDIIGLCEVENRFVMEKLIDFSALKKADYLLIHKDSPDERGIDVALIYREDKFSPFNFDYIQVEFPFNKENKTRDILYVAGVVGNDTLHIFVNHWPSRRGGKEASEKYRMVAATILRKVTDSIFAQSPEANIIVMGDLNDSPEDKSVAEGLGAEILNDNFSKSTLYSLSPIYDEEIFGTHKFQGDWETFDQFIVSSNLVNKMNNLHITENVMNVFSSSFLLENDEKYLGKKPFRTFYGRKYQNGFSDHLPVFIDLDCTSEQ